MEKNLGQRMQASRPRSMLLREMPCLFDLKTLVKVQKDQAFFAGKFLPFPSKTRAVVER